jgi:hypothetical protein
VKQLEVDTWHLVKFFIYFFKKKDKIIIIIGGVFHHWGMWIAFGSAEVKPP